MWVLGRCAVMTTHSNGEVCWAVFDLFLVRPQATGFGFS
jgi:hypothetical protein